MILVDFVGHMVATETEQELHDFAERLNMMRRWYQSEGYGLKHPHYDLTTSRMIEKALSLGAEQVSPAELVRRAWWQNRLKGGENHDS